VRVRVRACHSLACCFTAAFRSSLSARSITAATAAVTPPGSPPGAETRHSSCSGTLKGLPPSSSRGSGGVQDPAVRHDASHETKFGGGGERVRVIPVGEAAGRALMCRCGEEGDVGRR
jgi:hypothetical protein